MALTAGSKLGPYEILAPLGAGGMGEVYRARDSRLGRDVAVKVLTQHLAVTPELRQRFESEARAISSLNDPHICTVHDVGHQDGVDYLVMEYLEGETLATRLERGPIPTDQLLKTAIEIAEGLDKAHRHRIVHRDLKPGNIMLTKSGAKLMDFGLARATGKARSIAGAPSRTPTARQPITAEGTIVGTLQYMAPEQLEGKEADARTDLFSFGVVLYEMATGKKAFHADSDAFLIALIMTSEPPPITTIATMSPPALERVVRACLAKEPDERIQTAHDLKLQLQWIREAGSQAGVPAAVAVMRKRRERLGWIVVGLTTLALVAGAALVLVRVMRTPIPPAVVRFSVTPPENKTLSNDPAGSAISPDGKMLALIAADADGTRRIWIRPVESLAAQVLPGTENPALPFWSPDSRYLGFFADGKLMRVAVAGGSPEVLCDAPDGRGGAWGKNGVILFAPAAAGSIFRVSADGGEPVEILRPDSTRHETGLRWPEFLPDGRHFLFVSLPARHGNFDVYLASIDSKSRKRLLTSAAAPVYAEPGHLIFARNGRLMAARLDMRRLKLVGESVPLGEAPLATGPAGTRVVSTSANGILTHPTVGLTNTQFIWLDRSGRPQGTVSLPPGRYLGLSLSPDGQRMIVERQSSATAVDLWMVELSRAVATRFTFASASFTGTATWSPDGNSIAFNSNRDGPVDIYRKLANGAGAEEPLLQSSAPFKNLSQWSPDGRYLVFNQPDPVSGWDVWLLPLEGDRKPVPLLRSRSNESGGLISPDGRWISYVSDESGKSEVYVQSFPTAGKRYQVSIGGGGGGVWSKNGREMLLGSPDGMVMVVDVHTSPSFKAAVPRPLFKLRQDLIGITATLDFQRFLQTVPVGAVPPASITVELNWTAALKR